jgi:hypothetical protein
MQYLIVVLLAAALVDSVGPATQEQSDPELAKGIRQAQTGDFDSAVVTLDAVARRLVTQGGRPKELARTYVYLSIAYLGLSQEQKAKAQFLEAWKTDQGMELSAKEFPPKVLEFFEGTKAEARKAGQEASKPESPAASAAQPTPAAKTRGGSGKTLLVVGGVLAAGGAVAAAAGGGEGKSTPGGTAPPTSRPPATSPPATAPPGSSNHAPSVRFSSVDPNGSFISLVTQGQFLATASDPDNDVLTYTWDFGDGTAPVRTGSSLQHRFDSECACLVKVTVDDGRGGTASDTKTITASKISGNWSARFSTGTNLAANLNQTQSSFSGRFGNGASFNGRLANPRTMTINVDSNAGCNAGSYSGSSNDAVNRFELNGQNCVGSATLTLSR